MANSAGILTVPDMGIDKLLVIQCRTKLELAMQTTLTVRISDSEAQTLDGLCTTTGKSRSEVVRDSLRGYSLRESLRQSQAQLAPLARASGWLTEDDILNEVS
jgi:predicted transcriptional regulator